MRCKELFVDGDKGLRVITTQARESASENTGYSFVHRALLEHQAAHIWAGAWKTSPRVVFAYTDMSNVVNPAGWSDKNQPECQKTVFYGEFKCTGEGASPSGLVAFTKQLTEAPAQRFLVLGYIDGTKWQLPPLRSKTIVNIDTDRALLMY